jgi:hypothetical protein
VIDECAVCCVCWRRGLGCQRVDRCSIGLKAWAGWLAFLAAQSCFQDLPRRVSARGVVGDGLAAWWLRTSGEEAAFEVTFLSRAAVKQVDAAGPLLDASSIFS